MFLVFVTKLCPRIYISMNYNKIICFIFIKIISIILPPKLRPHKLRKFWLPRTLTPTNNDSPVIRIESRQTSGSRTVCLLDGVAGFVDSALCTLDTHSTSLLEEVSSLSIIFLRADLGKYVQIKLIISRTCTMINVENFGAYFSMSF